MKLFELHREKDLSGVSGTGCVAQGVEFDDGTCVLHWLLTYYTTAVYANVKTLLAIHGHEDATKIKWL